MIGAFSETEMNYLVDFAKPRLSRNRYENIQDIDPTAHKSEYRHNSQKRRIIHKTVQAWISEVEWPDLANYDYVGRNFTRMLHPILWKLSRKIELATQMQTQSHYSSQPFQVTNYGLGEVLSKYSVLKFFVKSLSSKSK